MSVHELAIAAQSAKGSAASANTHLLALTGGTIKARRVIEKLEETSDSRLRKWSYVKEVGAEGSPEYAVKIDLAVARLLLQLALGTISTTGIEDPWSHEITNGASRPYFTAWRMLQSLLYERFVDCKLVQLVITSEKGMPVKMAMTVQGLDPLSITSVTYASEVTAAEESLGPLMHYDGSGAFTVGGVVVSSIEKIVVTINNNDSFQQGDSLRGYELPEGMLDIGVEVTHLIENDDLYNLFHYGSASPTTGTRAVRTVAGPAGGIDFLWTGVSDTPGPERSLEIVIPELDIADVAGYEPNTGSEPLKATATYTVMKPSSGDAITATVINGEDLA